MGPFQNGMAYETLVELRLSNLLYKGIPINITARGGAGNAPDIVFKSGDVTCAIESKTCGAFEGGQVQFKLIDGILQLPKDSLHYKIIPEYKPFNSRIPPFMEGAIVKEQWNLVKDLFHDEYKQIDDLTVVGKYYREKGSYYIQIQNYGLYRTSEDDPLEFKVPLLECVCKIRTRCKTHSSTPLKKSVTCALNYDKNTLIKSPYCIMDDARLPNGLSLL
jgi:hypothetical protein